MKRCALVCVLVGMLAGCGGTAPALFEVNADDGSSGGSSSGGGGADAPSSDDATVEGSAEGSTDSTVDSMAPMQDAVAEANDGGVDALDAITASDANAANDATADVTGDAASEATIDAAADASSDVAADGAPEVGTDASVDAGPCTSGTIVCGPDGYQVQCQSDGGWAPYTTGCLCGYLCDSDGGVSCGGVAATCAVNGRQCSGNTPQGCVPYGPGICGLWTSFPSCVSQACVSGACTGVCVPGSSQCSDGGSAMQTCLSAGGWGTAIPCEGGTCAGGYCTGPADAGAGD